MSSPSVKKNVIAKQKRRRAVRKMLLTGQTNVTELAEIFGVNKQTISVDVRHIIQAWADADAQALVNDGERRAARIRSLELIMQEAYQSFMESKNNSETETVFTRYKKCMYCNGQGKVKAKGKGAKAKKCVYCEGGKIEVQEKKREVRGQVGEAAFLNVMRGALADIIKLEGLNAPIQFEGKTENTIIIEMLQRAENPPEIVTPDYIKGIAQKRLAHEKGNGSNGQNGSNGKS